MFLDETSSQGQFRDSARRSLGSVRPHFGAPMQAPDNVDPGMAEAADLGGLAIGFSEDIGGIPDSQMEFAILHAEAGRSLVAAPLCASAVLAGQLLERCCPVARRSEVIAPLLSGGAIAAVAGSSLRTGAILAEKQSSGWALSGNCTMVLALPQANWLVILANLDVAPLLFLVDAEAVTSSPYRLIDGRSAADVELSGHILSDDALVAEGHAVSSANDHAMRQFLIALSADALGSAERMIELTTEYMKIREQFGQPIAGFQALQHILAEMVADFEMSKSLLNSALLDEEGGPSKSGFSSAMLSLRVPSHAVAIGERSIQIHGGIGITEEYEVGHHYRRALVTAEIARAYCHNPRAVVRGQALAAMVGGVQ